MAFRYQQQHASFSYHDQLCQPQSASIRTDHSQLRRIAALQAHRQQLQQRSAARLATQANQQHQYAAPWNSSLANRPQPPRCSDSKATQPAKEMPFANRQMSLGKSPATGGHGNRIRSTIESLFHRNNHNNCEKEDDNSTSTTTTPVSSSRKTNKWRSIPGIRRSLSNLFVQQKQKRKPVAESQNTSEVTDTQPQPSGPLVRLRSPVVDSTSTTSRNSTSNTSADSGFEPEVVLVPHPSAAKRSVTNHNLTGVELDFDISGDCNKSLESLDEHSRPMMLGRNRAENEADDNSWPPPHLRDRGAISSPNIPRLMRKSNHLVTLNNQTFKPESIEVDDDDIDSDEEDDDFCETSQFDLTHPATVNTSGSLCHITTMATFLSTPGSQQSAQRRPRRIRAVSDHSLHRRSKEQRAQERELATAGPANCSMLQHQHDQHPSLLLSQSALSTTLMPPATSTLVKSATMGALAGSNKSRHVPKILSDVPRAEFTLTNSTTFFNKSETSLLTQPPSTDCNTSRNNIDQQVPCNTPSRPLPARPVGHHGPIPQNSAAMVLQSELQQHQQQLVYGRPFTVADHPTAPTGLTFEITPIMTPPKEDSSSSTHSQYSGQHRVMSNFNPHNKSLNRLNASPPSAASYPNSSTSPNSSAASSSSIENAPTKRIVTTSSQLHNPPTKHHLKTACAVPPSTGEIADIGGGDAKQQDQVFRRFGCQRLLEMQRRIEENCRLSERHQNEQEEVTRLLTNIRRNIRTTEI